MKEYILVILSGICKAVEKTKWPEEPKAREPISDSERASGLKFYDGIDMAAMEEYERQKREAFEGGALVDYFENERVLWMIFSDKLALPERKKENIPQGVYPIDPSKWEVVEQWQIKANESNSYWKPCDESGVPAYQELGYSTRLTATIKPKEHSTGPIIPEGAHVAVMEPTRKLVTEELIDYLNSRKIGGASQWDYLISEVVKVAQSLKAKEIDNIKQAFNQGYREGEQEGGLSEVDSPDISEFGDARFYITQTYQPK